MVHITVKSGTVQDVLHQIRQQDPAYQVKMIRGRLLVYPDLPLLKTVITLPPNGRIKRITAACELSDYVRGHVKGFERFGTMFSGSLGSGLFQNFITLDKRGTILEYLAQIAGDDLGAALDIPYWSNDWYALNVREVAIWKATPQGSSSPQSPSGSSALLPYDEPNRGFLPVSQGQDIHSTHKPGPTQMASGNQQLGLNPSLLAGSAGALASKLLVSGQLQPSAATNGTCRLLSIAYTKGSYVDCKNVPGIDPNNTCGYHEQWTANSVTFCTGDDCVGQSLSESVQGGGQINQASGTTCPIGTGGTLSGCTDYYGACGAAPPPPGSPIVLTDTQTISVGGGATSIVNTITTTITDCGKGTVNQTQTPAGTQDQCCGNNPPASGAGSKTLCSSSQVCVNGDVCCNAGVTAACDHICCLPNQHCLTDNPNINHHVCCPSTSAYACGGVCCAAGQTCVTDTILKKTVCCPTGSNLACNGTCCGKGEICITDSATGHYVCCPSGTKTTCNDVCCSAGSVCINGKCCANACAGVCCNQGETCVGGVCCPSNRLCNPTSITICCPPGQTCVGSKCQ